MYLRCSIPWASADGGAPRVARIVAAACTACSTLRRDASARVREPLRRAGARDRERLARWQRVKVTGNGSGLLSLNASLMMMLFVAFVYTCIQASLAWYWAPCSTLRRTRSFIGSRPCQGRSSPKLPQLRSLAVSWAVGSSVEVACLRAHRGHSPEPILVTHRSGVWPLRLEGGHSRIHLGTSTHRLLNSFE